jgi:hypothetical protein
VSHLDGESKLFVCRTSAAVVARENIEFKSTALQLHLRKTACHWNREDENSASRSPSDVVHGRAARRAREIRAADKRARVQCVVNDVIWYERCFWCSTA